MGPPTGWVLGRRLFIASSLKSTAKTRGDLKSTIKAAAECFLHPKITAIFLNYSFTKNCQVPPAPPSSLVKAMGAARGLEDHTTSHPSLPGWVSHCPPRSTVPTPVPFTPPVALTTSVKREKILLLAWICTANRLKREVHVETQLALACLEIPALDFYFFLNNDLFILEIHLG